jgi:hypothetical protein
MAPSTANESSKYGYEDADASASAERQRLGYGDAGDFVRTPRRSSLKQPGRPRRASIQFGGEIEVRLPGQCGTFKRRTSIDFCDKPTVVVQEIPPENEPNNTIPWMDQAEYDVIQKNNAKIVKNVERGTDKKFCLRGLEGMLSTSNLEIDRKDAVESVMEEQTTQRQYGQYDEDRISEQYRYSTMNNKWEAGERAQQDNAEVEGYLKSTRKMMRRLSV